MARFAQVLAALVLAFVGLASAFVAPSAFSGAALRAPALPRAATPASASVGTVVMADTYWEGKAPPSSVLGPLMEKAPSGVLGIASIFAFALGTYCVHESNILNTVNPDNLNAQYIAGYTLVPISWGLHVASWINKTNGN